MPDPLPPPATCPIGWQPQALTPVFYGARDLGTADGAPVDLRVWFPSLDGAVWSAPLLEGCGSYPLVILCHGHCTGDPVPHQRWFLLPAQLARSGYVVVVPFLGGVSAGVHPSTPGHPDLATLEAVHTWVREDWEHHDVLLPPPATAVIGHSYGAMVGARYAASIDAAAYAGLSGVWQDWPSGPWPIEELDGPSLLVWGGDLDFFTAVPDSKWNAMPRPRHKVVFAEGEHWDYLSGIDVPCSPGPGPCAGLGAATNDLVAMFLGRYLPPELATDLPGKVPANLTPPALDLTTEQEFFAGGNYLESFAALAGSPGCEVTVTSEMLRLMANRRTRETHSRDDPCAWMHLVAPSNRWFVEEKPAGYNWCDFCFPHLADG